MRYVFQEILRNVQVSFSLELLRAVAVFLFYHFLINYLAAPGPTLGHCREDSLTNANHCA